MNTTETEAQLTWLDVLGLVASLLLWLGLLLLTFYTLVTLPFVVVAGLYVLYLVVRLRARAALKRSVDASDEERS